MTVANAPQHAGAVDDSRRGRILRRALLTVCVLVLVLGVTVYCHARETEAPDCSQWEIIFDGYGEASCSEGLLRLKPTSADSHDTTHAGLATSTSVEIEAGGVQTIHTTMTTVRQLREDGEPNAWEVSKQDTAYPGYQRFLSSGNTPVYPPGKSHDVTVTIDTTTPSEATFTITVDGQELGTVTDKQSPYRSGKVAAYCEDSDVTFTPITEDK